MTSLLPNWPPMCFNIVPVTLSGIGVIRIQSYYFLRGDLDASPQPLRSALSHPDSLAAVTVMVLKHTDPGMTYENTYSSGCYRLSPVCFYIVPVTLSGEPSKSSELCLNWPHVILCKILRLASNPTARGQFVELCQTTLLLWNRTIIII